MSSNTDSNILNSEVESSNLTPQLSSFEVFMSFVENKDDAKTVNVDKVFSTECFHLWLKSRAKTPKQPRESFRRALTSHVRGTDQRKPFPPIVEKALLVKLRQKKSWACFENLGRYGFRGQGFHENKANPAAKKRKRKTEEGGEHLKSASKEPKVEGMYFPYNQQPVYNVPSHPLYGQPLYPPTPPPGMVGYPGIPLKYMAFHPPPSYNYIDPRYYSQAQQGYRRHGSYPL